MARPLRIEYEGAVYHVTSRGNARNKIFNDNRDREIFLSILSTVVVRYSWLCHSYCLMDNHYHIMIETPDANLSMGMRQLNGIYTQKYNKRHHKTGHIFEGRFKAILVQKDNYLLELCRYVVLNPVRAGVVGKPEDWRWSSYQATAGLERGGGLPDHRLDSECVQHEKRRGSEAIPGVCARGDQSEISMGGASGAGPSWRRGFCREVQGTFGRQEASERNSSSTEVCEQAES